MRRNSQDDEIRKLDRLIRAGDSSPALNSRYWRARARAGDKEAIEREHVNEASARLDDNGPATYGWPQGIAAGEIDLATLGRAGDGFGAAAIYLHLEAETALLNGLDDLNLLEDSGRPSEWTPTSLYGSWIGSWPDAMLAFVNSCMADVGYSLKRVIVEHQVVSWLSALEAARIANGMVRAVDIAEYELGDISGPARSMIQRHGNAIMHGWGRVCVTLRPGRSRRGRTGISGDGAIVDILCDEAQPEMTSAPDRATSMEGLEQVIGPPRRRMDALEEFHAALGDTDTEDYDDEGA